MYYGSLHAPAGEAWKVKICAHHGGPDTYWVELAFDGGTIDIHASRDQFLRFASVIVGHLAPWCDSDFTAPEPTPRLNPFGEEYHVE